MIKKSILGGIVISISAYCYINNKGIIGALLFSLGLMVILNYKLPLFTGKCGYTELYGLKLLCILFFNIIGVILIGIILKCNTEQFWASEKLLQPYHITFIKAIGCGMLMFVSVDSWKNNKLVLLFAIPVFILCGFEHCIADAFYFVSTRTDICKSIIYISICASGNITGSLIFRYLKGWNE